MIVVSGLKVRDVELGRSDDCEGVGVIEGVGEREGDSLLDEALSWVVVEVVVEWGSKVRVSVGGGSLVVVLGGGCPVVGGGGALSLQISGRVLGNRSAVRTSSGVQTAERIRGHHPSLC